MKHESPGVILFPSFPPTGEGERWKEKERHPAGGYGSARPSTWSGHIRRCRGLCSAARRAARSLPPVLGSRGRDSGWHQGSPAGRPVHPGSGWTPALRGPFLGRADWRAPYLTSGGGGRGRTDGRIDGRNREPLRRRRWGLREARRRRSSGAAGGRAALSLRRTADPTSPWQPPVPGPAESPNP